MSESIAANLGYLIGYYGLPTLIYLVIFSVLRAVKRPLIYCYLFGAILGGLIVFMAEKGNAYMEFRNPSTMAAIRGDGRLVIEGGESRFQPNNPKPELSREEAMSRATAVAWYKTFVWAVIVGGFIEVTRRIIGSFREQKKISEVAAPTGSPPGTETKS